MPFGVVSLQDDLVRARQKRCVGKMRTDVDQFDLIQDVKPRRPFIGARQDTQRLVANKPGLKDPQKA